MFQLCRNNGAANETIGAFRREGERKQSNYKKEREAIDSGGRGEFKDQGTRSDLGAFNLEISKKKEEIRAEGRNRDPRGLLR